MSDSDEGEFRDISEICAEDLNILLARYFLSVRKNDGEEYEPGTFIFNNSNP